MLNFQTDEDEKTGEQVLTCFLLPQLEIRGEANGMSFSVILIIYTCNQIIIKCSRTRIACNFARISFYNYCRCKVLQIFHYKVSIFISIICY